MVVHRHVLLDDRGGIEIGNNVSISDYVNVYSHTHDIHEISKVYNLPTRISNNVRLTYHCTVLAGCHIGEDAMVGTGAALPRMLRPDTLWSGFPQRLPRLSTNPLPQSGLETEIRAHKSLLKSTWKLVLTQLERP